VELNRTQEKSSHDKTCHCTAGLSGELHDSLQGLTNLKILQISDNFLVR
jgi:ABC-type transport system involved in cytochrome bd biosynthesis fused ATPase/permease subunit